MPKLLNILSFASLLATAGTVLIYYCFRIGIFLPLSFTFATTAYHFVMRLGVGGLVNRIMKNRADLRKKWYQEYPFEPPLYRILRVKKWKNKLPTYDPQVFSWKDHSFSELAQAMCQAEITHEIIVALSFLPLLASLKFGAFFTWLVTSVLAAGFDFLFVLVQRYNRPRAVKLAQKQTQSS